MAGEIPRAGLYPIRSAGTLSGGALRFRRVCGPIVSSVSRHGSMTPEQVQVRDRKQEGCADA
jgi:hypothetical protein